MSSASLVDPASLESSLDLGEVYKSCGPSVLRRARCILGNDDEAHDILQELFVFLVQHPEQFAGRSSIMTYLYRATTNRCINRLRDHANRSRILAGQQSEKSILERAGALSAAEQTVTLRSILRQMPADVASIAVYYFVDDMTHDEIAKIVGCSRRHVGNVLARLGQSKVETLKEG